MIRETEIHPTAIIGGPPQHFRGHEGRHPVETLEPVSIGPFTTVDCGTVRSTYIGMGTQIMGHCNVGHDARIGDRCQIANSVVVCGHAEVGDDARIGAGARILPFVRIGGRARVGAGAVVTRDVDPYTLVAGVPARVLSRLCREGCWARVGDDAPHGRCPSHQASYVGGYGTAARASVGIEAFIPEDL